ncbi:MAG: PKD domain-containing protein [Candidatus Bathycorpusculaceae bacterium]
MKKPLIIVLTMLMTASFCMSFNLPTSMKVMAQSDTNVLVDVLLDYGNGTQYWSSCVLSKPGNSTVYNATQLVATTLNITWYGSDVFVDAINNVWNSYPYYWMWWYWNFTASQWELGPVACNMYALEDLDIIAWYYEDISTWPPELPANPPLTTVNVLLDYGNGTIKCNENVEVIGYASVLKATKMVATVDYSLWGTDVFVDAIDGVWNDYGTNYFWLYWSWNNISKSWDMPWVACNKYIMANGETVAWYYETSPWGPPAYNLYPRIDVLLDYGNGTLRWFENVEVSGLASVLKATETVALVEYTLWGDDVFVDAINGVANSYPYYWMWWYWNFTESQWVLGPVACNKYFLTDGYIIAWNYVNVSTWPPAQPSSTPYPIAEFTWSPIIPKVGETVIFDASASAPNGGTITQYKWDFGDGHQTTGKIVSHTYTSPNTYTVTLNVSDSNGLWGIKQKQIVVVKPYGPKAAFTVTPETATVNQNIKFDASSSQPGWNGTHTMPITAFVWNFGDGNITTTNQPVIYHAYKTAGIYYVTLTVRAPGATPEENSTTYKVTVAAIPVGGYSIIIKGHSAEKPLTLYALSLVGLTVAYTAIRRKLSRRISNE